jgi:hypothetical protein
MNEQFADDVANSKARVERRVGREIYEFEKQFVSLARLSTSGPTSGLGHQR